MALSFGTRIKFLLGHIWLSISLKVIRGPSSLVLPSLPSLVSILLPMVFNKSVFAPTRASVGVYTILQEHFILLPTVKQKLSGSLK